MSATERHAPQGFHTVTPYLIVNNARAAIDFYGRAFGAVELSVNKNDNGKVLHAEVSIGDSPVMLAEECEFNGIVARSPHALGGISMQLYMYVPDVDGLVARALSAGAKEVMPVADQPYGDRSGGVVDPFGHVWWLATSLSTRRSQAPAGTGG